MNLIYLNEKFVDALDFADSSEGLIIQGVKPFILLQRRNFVDQGFSKVQVLLDVGDNFFLQGLAFFYLKLELGYLDLNLIEGLDEVFGELLFPKYGGHLLNLSLWELQLHDHASCVNWGGLEFEKLFVWGDRLKLFVLEFVEQTDQLKRGLKLVVESITVYDKSLELVKNSVAVLYFGPLSLQHLHELIGFE